MEVLDLPGKSFTLRKNHLHGKISLWLAIGGLVILASFFLFLMQQVHIAMKESGYQEDYFKKLDLKLLLVWFKIIFTSASIIHIAGMIFGLFGLFKNQYKKTLAWIGVVGNGLPLLAFLTIIIVYIVSR